MGFRDLFRARDETGAATENQNAPITLGDIGTIDDVLLSALLKGEPITKEMALTVPAVAAAVDMVAGMVASMPVRLYKINKGAVEEVTNDRRLSLLNADTGDTLNGYEFKKAMVTDYLMGSGGYAYIERNRNDVTGLYYVDEEQINVNINSDPIRKNFTILCYDKQYEPHEFIRLLRNTKDGARGCGVTAELSKQLETAYQTLVYQLGLVQSGGNKRGFLKTQRKLGQAEINALKRAWRNLYANNEENVVILNNGLEFQEAANTSVEMQLNENKKTLNDEINAIFHINTGDFYETFKSAIYPVVKAFEAALNSALLLEKEKGKRFFEFDVKEIVKANIKERYEAYKLANDIGFMTKNELRQMENMNTYEGGDVINYGLAAVLYDVQTGTYYTPNTDKQANTAPDDGGATDSKVVDKTLDKVDDVVRKPLLVGQMQALESIVAGLTGGTYSYEQAKNMLIVGVGLSAEDAEKVLNAQQEAEETTGTEPGGGEEV